MKVGGCFVTGRLRFKVIIICHCDPHMLLSIYLWFVYLFANLYYFVSLLWGSFRHYIIFRGCAFFIESIEKISKILFNCRWLAWAFYNYMERENLSLNSIQTLSRLYPLLPPHPIHEELPEIPIIKIPVISNNINFYLKASIV